MKTIMLVYIPLYYSEMLKNIFLERKQEVHFLHIGQIPGIAGQGPAVMVMPGQVMPRVNGNRQNLQGVVVISDDLEVQMYALQKGAVEAISVPRTKKDWSALADILQRRLRL